jgi:hypothetical protein
MGAFGPFYPGRLQELVNHAERMSRLLMVEEGRGRCDGFRDAWLAGRAGELERFVESLTDDWKRRPRRFDSVVSALSAYLEELHDGMLATLGSRGLDCCLAGLDTTTIPLPGRPHDGAPDGEAHSPSSR